MPGSMFGLPSQHLLPSHPPPSVSDGPSDPHTAAPLQPSAIAFKDFRFSSIGKQPDLLSRITFPQSDHTDYHSPTPSPTSTPPPIFINDRASQSKPSSRQTLLQQLAGSDSGSMATGSGSNAPTGQPSGSLASRINMDGSPSNDIPTTVRSTVSRFPSPPLRFTTTKHAAENASLIPPVEFLPQQPDSSPSTPASWLPPLEPVDVHSRASSTPLMNVTTITASRIPTPTVATNTASRETTESFPSLAVVDAMMRDLQPLPSTAAAIDSLMARQDRLQSISVKLANLGPLALPPQSQSQSPSPDPSVATPANDNITPDQSSQLQHTSTPIVLRQSHSAGQLSGSNMNSVPMRTNDSPLACVPSPMTLVQEHQAQRRAITEAIQNLNSVLEVAQRAQIDSENTLAHRIRTLEDQRVTFEQKKRAEEATLQRELQELQQKRQELDAKEALLASLEKESKAREDARKGVLQKRQAQEEERRAAEAKRVQEVQQQIANAMNELKEIEALKAKCQLEQLTNETVSNHLPTEPREGMNREEIAAIKSRNDLLCAIKHLRRMHTDKMRGLEESNRTLHRLTEERNKREAGETERRRIAEEERARAHAEIERARQVQDEKRRQFEGERKRQVENGREQAQLLVEQQAHAEAQAHGLGRTETTHGQTFEHHPGNSEKDDASQHKGIADTTRIRVVCKRDSPSPVIISTMNVDEDGMAPTPRPATPLSDVHTSPRRSQSKQKKDKPISGGVMLATPTLKASDGHLPPKLSSFSSSDHVAENTPNSASTSPVAPVSAEDRRKSSFPAVASGINHASFANIRSTPDHKPAFSRTPKSQTILDAANGGSQELNIGPVAGVSPTQQNVNLRHLKRFRDRVEGNDNGDRSVRTTNVKSEENSHIFLKKEDQSCELVASFSTDPSPSLPLRPTIIPPPRPRISKKRHEEPASQADSTSSYPPESNGLSLTSKEVDMTINEHPREAFPPDTPNSQAVITPVQLSVSPRTMNSHSSNPESRPTESCINAGEKSNQDRGENTSEPASATPSHELDWEDLSGNDRRFPDKYRKARNANDSRRVSDHHSPPSITPPFTVASPIQLQRPIDSRRPQNSGPRVEPMRATSPTMGRKRPSELDDNDYGHRVRRQRGDVWTAQDHDRDWADSRRPHWDKRLDSEPDERRASYRAPPYPPDRFRPYPSEVPRATYDNRTYISPLPEEPTSSTRREHLHKAGKDGTYQRDQPMPGNSAATDHHHTDNTRVGQTYEPKTEEKMDTQSEPPLLARIHNTQRFLPRGRGRGEPSRGRGEFGRGRGRSLTRSGPPLIDRLTSGPSSLEDRLT